MAIIALDLGGTKLSAALFTSKGKILECSRTPLLNRAGKDVGTLIQGQIRTLGECASRAGLKIDAVGVCVPGISFHDTGRVWAPNIPGWEKYPLRKEIADVFSNSNSPTSSMPRVKIENDRACYILGEEWMGAAKGCRNAVFVAVGTGIGAGLLVNGRVADGAHGTAGSIGWMALQRPFLPDYKKWGCFEHHASGAGLGRTAVRFSRTKSRRAQATALDVFASFKKGGAMGRRAIKEAVQFWGMGVANIVSLIDPEIIIFGGGVFGPALNLLPQIRAEAERWAQPVSMKLVRLAASKLGSDAGLYGAARVALS